MKSGVMGLISGVCGMAMALQAAQVPVLNLNPDADGGIQSINLNGIWSFRPADGAWSVGSRQPGELDSAAAKVDETLAGTNIWYSLAVPQFLNRIEWWLTRVSPEFEEQETQRIAAMPFNVTNTTAGWYLQKFSLPPMAGPAPEIVAGFEGVAMISRVYCNGHYAGGHLGMFGAFECRLTPYLKWGAENNLLVYVERGTDAKDGDTVVSVAVTVPVTRNMLTSLNRGVFGGFGRGANSRFMGIWQPVTLKVSRSGGRILDVFFNPTLEGQSIEMTMQNPAGTPVAGRLVYRISDVKSGKMLTRGELPEMTLDAGSTKIVVDRQQGLTPEHWTPDRPHLYELVVEWRSPGSGGAVIDRWTHRVGYRTVEVRGRQVYLNGKPYWCRGANQPPYGYRPNDAPAARAFLQLMHDGNTVITRAHCNPFNHLWFSLADEIGVGISSEGVRPWALMSKQPPPPAAILKHWKEEQLETTRQYRNHPSILLYCISNEGLQGDDANPEKLAIFKDIIASVRVVDPSRPIFQTSGDYDRLRSADLEDVHSYWGWYDKSSFVNDYRKPMVGLSATPGRAFLNQECAVPYQNTDTGGVHPVYIPHYMAHPWIGTAGVENPDPAWFNEHISRETKRKCEQLRYRRREMPTAGVMLFCNSTWVQHVLSHQPDQWKPFPVYEAAAEGFAPVLVALESPQFVFYAGDMMKTRVFVVNDDVDFRDRTGLSVTAEVLSATGKRLAATRQELGDVPYFGVRDWPFEMVVPSPDEAGRGRIPATLRLVLSDAAGAVSTNHYAIGIATHEWSVGERAGDVVAVAGCSKDVEAHIRGIVRRVVPLSEATGVDVVLLGPEARRVKEQEVLRVLRPGGRLVILEQGAKAGRFCADVLKLPAWPNNIPVDNKKRECSERVVGEFVEMVGWASQRKIFQGLDYLDWKWWMQGGDQPAIACTANHKIDLANPSVVPIGRFLDSHFYWPGKPGQMAGLKTGYAVFAVKRPWGELIVCDLAVTKALPFDPRAARTLSNLMIWPLE